MPAQTKALKVIVATHSKHVASSVDRQLKSLGLSSTTIEPTLVSLTEGIGDSEPSLVVVDAVDTPCDSIALVRQLREARPQASVVVLGRSADLEVIARAVVAGASQFLLLSTPPDESAKAAKDLVAGKMPSEEGLFGRIYGAFPAPGGANGFFRTHSGKRLSTAESIKQCDQFGLTTDEISEYLKVPLNEVERVTKKARKVVRPSLLSQIVPALLPMSVGSSASLSRRNLLAILGLLVAVWAVVGYLRHDPRRHLIAGEVTYEGKPVKIGTIRFTPESRSGSPSPMVEGEIREGRYVVRPRHGSHGGTYKVQVSGFTGVPKKSGSVTDPKGDPLFPEVMRTALVPCSGFTFNVRCDAVATSD
jgi:DNA-binding NarL/FixJ family response regulator